MTSAVVPFRSPGSLPDAPPPPHSTEVEQALLGALLHSNASMVDVAPLVEAEHFFFADHQEIYTCIGNLIAQGIEANPLTVRSYLPHPTVSDVPAGQYLAHLHAAATTTNAKGYAAIVRDLATRRLLVTIGDDLVERARNEPIEATGSRLIEDAMGELLLARNEVPNDRSTSMTAARGPRWMIDRIRALQEGTIAGSAVSTGIIGLDRITGGGFQRGQLWLLAARPGMGKTVAMTSFSRYAAREAGALVFQLEVTPDQQWARYLADLSYIHNRPLTFGQIMAGDVDEDGLWRLEDAEKRYARLHLNVDCRPSISVAQIAFAVKAEKKRLAGKGVTLGTVFIDYLKFIKVSDRYKGQRVLEIGEITGTLKQIAKAEDICVVLLTQLSRQTEAQQREDRRPVLADLRDSGELEQDADCVLFLYRDAYYLERKVKSAKDEDARAEAAQRLAERANSLEIILGKNRAGPCHTLDLWCDVSASTIAQAARGPV